MLDISLIYFHKNWFAWKEKSEDTKMIAVNRRRTENTMAKGQTMIQKILRRKLKIEQLEPHY